ncbi:MAG: hypothetical protein JJT82_04035 [Legionellaceae bacterium]|nr:hypothetical protein [Legionellaceae bacterium]
MTNIHSNKISQGIVQYLCDFAKYTHQQIAVLSNLPIEVVDLIYYHESPPTLIDAHLKLLKLYAVAIELEKSSLKSI